MLCTPSYELHLFQLQRTIGSRGTLSYEIRAKLSMHTFNLNKFQWYFLPGVCLKIASNNPFNEKRQRKRGEIDNSNIHIF